MTIQKLQDREIQSHVNNQAIVNECLEYALSSEDSDDILHRMLSCLGSRLECDRTYIFEEVRKGRLCNTYEWCAPQIISQQEDFQYATWQTIAEWNSLFNKGRCIIIEDVEEIREINASEYAWLKVQGIRTLVACPLLDKDNLIGFFGMSNCPRERVKYLSTILKVIAHFIVGCIRQRNLVRHLRFLSYHDQLTGVMNRYALQDFIQAENAPRPLGVVYCDISGLKQVNDIHGHTQGDQLIVNVSQLLSSQFPDDYIYRVGGDEFLVLCFGSEEDAFLKRTARLQDEVASSSFHLAVGTTWSPTGSTAVKELCITAENKMYQNKELFYREHKTPSKESSTRRHISPPRPAEGSHQTPFQVFVQHNYFDSEAFFQSVAIPEAPYYLYFGDLQSNLYYISDNMRDDFGFSGNMVYDLINKWALRIFDTLDRELYSQDLDQLLTQKKDMHSLRYRVTDKNGYSVWVHCRGIIKWTEDKATPLFFSGCISRLENNFSIDVTTGFLKERAALNEFTLLGAKKSSALVVGFTLNHFTYVNETRGRSDGDRLLKNIANALLKELDDRYTFYRLDGMRFMAVSRQPESCPVPSVVDAIRRIIEAQYSRQRISAKHAASFGVLHFPENGRLPQEILENTMTLINAAKLAPDLEYSEFSQDVIRRKRDKSQMALSLNECVEKGCVGFRLVVQPIVCRDTGSIIGGETLLRWKYQGRDIPPAIFIPLLEDSRLILPVGKWVFKQAVQICREILRYQPDFLLSFNVSYLQVLDDSFLPFMRQTLDEIGLPGQNLMLELTETQFDEMPDRLQKFVEACLDMGMKFALDDFGNGFSSLQLLLKYPVDVIKLDRTLMNEITHSTENLDFIMSIVYACHRSGKLVCVEGVETVDELTTVQQTDCDMIQGFYFFKPMELEDFYQKLL